MSSKIPTVEAVMKRLFLLAITLLFPLCQASTVAGQDMSQRALARAPLFDAIAAGDKDAVLKILSKRHPVKLNHREPRDGETFLIAAIRADQPEIVRILLTHGANPNLREITAVDGRNERPSGDSPLAAAVNIDSIEMVRLLIQHGVRLAEHPYALHSAPSIEMIRFLLDHGAAIDGRDENGATYLHTAANNEEIEDIARLLIERGANVNAPDKDGASPLFRVASVKIARLLIERGANVNAADREGRTPLHFAVSEGPGIELAKLLVLRGADVNARNREGHTALDLLVVDSFDQDFALFLVAHGARVNEYLVKEYGLVEEFEEIRKTIQSGTQRPDSDF
jgi:serine/threonine-protein phosphatase 6 regulatory ankyrin repeat subunit B